MRMAMLILAVGVILAWMLPSASGGAVIGKIDITATIVSTRVEASPNRQGAHRSTHLRLWNHAITHKPIGHAFITCAFIGRGGELGKRGVWTCGGIYRLPLGLITSAGITHSHYRYTSAITGGTRKYVGQGGVIFTRRIGPSTLRVVMQLPND